MTVHSAAGEQRGGGDKRARILASAERVFARRGFFAARVSEIAKDAGVADGTIYLYFKSKDEILISLFEERMAQVNAALTAAVAAAPKSPREKLRAFVKTYLRLIDEEPAAAEVLTIELRQSNKFMKEYDNPRFADFLRMLGGIVAAGQETGEFGKLIPSHVAARMIFGMLDELALAWVLARSPTIPAGAPGHRPKKFDIVRAADWAVALITNGIGSSSNAMTKETP